MKKIVPFILIISVTTINCSLYANAPSLHGSAPGHVWSIENPVTFQSSKSGASWQVTDWLGKPCAQGICDEKGNAVIRNLPIGYYHLQAGTQKATFAIVPPLKSRSFDKSSFYGVDSAQSWVSRKGGFKCPWYEGDTFRVVSDLIALAGIPHVRERLSVRDVNPQPNQYNWMHYFYNAELLNARNILVSGMFHDSSPHWQPKEKLPTNLMAVYNFCNKAGSTFGNRMGDWEFWNEEDIGFAPEAVWDYAAALKAAYLGFKSANPNQPIMMGAVCHPERNAYDEILFANDIAYYTDIFNFHTYMPLSQYPTIFADLRNFIKNHHLGNIPVWLTESGTNLEGHSKDDGVFAGIKAHSPEQELIHAEFYTKSQILLQQEGVARNYFFIFGAYNEANGAKDWGVIRRDGTVKPIYSAISTITHELLTAKLEGEISLDKGIRAFLFKQPDNRQTLVFWTLSAVDTQSGNVQASPLGSKSITLPIPAQGKYTLTDLCGQTSTITTNVVTATRYPMYITGFKTPLQATTPPFPTGILQPRTKTLEDPSIIYRVDLNTNDFCIEGSKSVATLKHSNGGCLTLQVWNLENQPKTGTLTIANGTLTGIPSSITIPAQSCVTLKTNYQPNTAPNAPYTQNLTISGIFNGKHTSRLVIPVQDTPRFLATCRKQPLLRWQDPKAWHHNSSATKCEITWDEKEQAICFDCTWDKPTDRWFYPVYDLTPEESFDGACQFVFEVKSEQNKVENDFNCQNLMLVYTTGSDRFLSYTAPLQNWERRTIVLPTKHPPVKSIRLGANPRGTHCRFWIRNPQLLMNN